VADRDPRAGFDRNHYRREGDAMKQELENILPSEVEAIKAALLTALLGEIPKGTREMIDYALRIIEHRRRGRAENDRRSLQAVADDCAKYGSD
jgi:hypothetical protein